MMAVRCGVVLALALWLLPASGSAWGRVPVLEAAAIEAQVFLIHPAAVWFSQVNPRDPSIKLKLEACMLKGDLACVIAQWMLLHGYKDPPVWLAQLRDAFATTNRAAGKCVDVAKAIHHGLRQMGQAAQFARISVQGPRPLLGFDEMVNGQLVKTHQVSTNGLHWAVRVNGRIVDAYTGLAGLPEEEYMQRLQPYPGARIVVDFLEEML
jgi:hypothetical protein